MGSNTDQMRNISIATLIEETILLTQERFRTANITLKVQLDYHGNLVCRDTQISQVLIILT